VQWFLRACLDANTRDKVDSSILESSTTLREILMQEFSVTLPAFYLPEPSRPNPTEARASAPSNAKRLRGNPTTDHGPAVTNNNKNPAWDIVRLNLPFRDFNSYNNPGPPDICRKWHLKGFCNADCDRKISHQVLVGQAKHAFSQWFNSCK
jgi:hypothetical protein